MHKLVIQTDKPMIDHRNGNTLDNRKQNLRGCTTAQNQRNRNKRSGASSGYKGVSWKASDSVWVAQFRRPSGKRMYKRFDSEIAAAGQYNAWARKHHGEFARLNDIPAFKAAGVRFMEEA